VVAEGSMPKLTKTRDRGWRDRYQREVWRKRAKNWLATHPCCALCAARGLAVPATICDHITPDRNADWLTFLSAPVQSLCAPCHVGDKRRMQHGRRPRPTFGLDGYPLPDGQRLAAGDDHDGDDDVFLIA
jgi:5-methylcytosine-specific restriction enzyme A